MTFAEKLNHIRKGRGLSLAALEKQVGITKKTLISYEQGRSLPRSQSTYAKLSEFFGVPMEFWKEEREDDFQKAAMYARGEAAKLYADKLVSEIAGLFAGGELSHDDREAVMSALQRAYWKVLDEEKAVLPDD